MDGCMSAAGSWTPVKQPDGLSDMLFEVGPRRAYIALGGSTPSRVPHARPQPLAIIPGASSRRNCWVLMREPARNSGPCRAETSRIPARAAIYSYSPASGGSHGIRGATNPSQREISGGTGRTPPRRS